MQLNEATIIHSPAFELSIGQQQRVAAARSLIGSPELIIADEPTSALDHDVRQVFINLLFDEVADAGATLLFISHDPGLADQFDRRIKLTDINELH
jgi:putative ABC transport system ATP-binding protein